MASNGPRRRKGHVVPVGKKFLKKGKVPQQGEKVPQITGDDAGDTMSEKIAPVFLSVMFFSLLGHF